MHFGLEEWVAGNTPYVEYTDVDGGAGQFGVRSSGVWQRHLSAGLGISESTYDLPGGAHGRMQTDAFSLAGYTATDKPTLYFSYWLETQDAEDNKLDQMQCVTVHVSLVPSMAVKRGNCWRRIIKRDRHSILGRRLNCRHGSLRHRMLQMLVQMPVSDSRFRNSLTPPSGGRHESTLVNLLARVQCFAI